MGGGFRLNLLFSSIPNCPSPHRGSRVLALRASALSPDMTLVPCQDLTPLMSCLWVGFGLIRAYFDPIMIRLALK